MRKESKEFGNLELRWWRSRTAEEIVSGSREALSTDSRLTTGSEMVDNAFNGGIPKHILFEITGEAGTGKTQWCFTLIASVLLRSVDFKETCRLRENAGIVCVIYTDNGVFSKERLFEILRSRLELECKGASSRSGVEGSEGDSLDLVAKKLMSYVKVYRVNKLEEMYDFVQRVVPGLCLNHKIDAIFIDSITSIYRSRVSFSEDSSVSTGLLRLSNAFKRISLDHDCWLVVTNQTTTQLSDSRLFTGGSGRAGNQRPSLGLLWSNIVNWRIFLSRRASKRELSVELSSEIPRIR
ncbi:DNA repair protein XRCC3 [Cryptosporidium felis]|nr:DNA repair protein XRCC3 [Cryptosporidium felis]